MEASEKKPFRLQMFGLSLAAILLTLLFYAGSVRGATLDIMLVYDTTASTWVAGNGGMEAFSQDVVNRMNQAVDNTGLDMTFRLVHSASVDYTHEDFETDLNALQTGTGEFSGTHTLRDDYGADLVALLVDTGSPYGWVGLGYTLWRYSGTPNYSFTVNAIQAVDISHTMTHEVGHNLGAHHSKYQDSSPGPNEYLDNQYSAGWYFTGNGADYHTIMAYNQDGFGNSYQSAPLFSTPLVTYNGGVAGDPDHGDNARLIRDTMDTIAAYRTAYGSLTVTIDPSGAVTDGAKWRRAELLSGLTAAQRNPD